MNYRYTYFQYGPGGHTQGHASGPRYGDSEHSVWEPDGGRSREPFSSWFGTGERMFRSLPWIGAAAIGLGALIILFPMLLVIAVAAVFFFAGAACLGLWWRMRGPSQAHFDAAQEWDRAKSWFKKRFA